MPCCRLAPAPAPPAASSTSRTGLRLGPNPPPPPPACSPNHNALTGYQACEHSLNAYHNSLEPTKISLPAGILRDFVC